MAEYGKLTVVKLKEVLKERGLPVSGNKAALVARLEENDAEDQEEKGAEDHGAQEHTEDAATGSKEDSGVELSVPAEEGAAPEVEPQDAPSEGQAAASPETSQEDAMDPQADAASASEPSMVEYASEEKVQAKAESTHPPEEGISIEGAVQEQEETDTRPLGSMQPGLTQASTKPSAPILETPSESQRLDEPMMDAAPSISQPVPTQISVQHVTLTQDTNESSLKPEEVVEDTKKRKRRSQSPIPDSVEIATKKARAIDGSPRVTVTEDVESQEVGQGGDGEEQKSIVEDSQDSMVVKKSEISPQVVEKPEAQAQAEEETAAVHEVEGDSGTREKGIGKSPSPEEPKSSILSPSKTPTNAKFKGLFAATASSQPTRTDSEQNPVEDREVEPALHTATTALYIRNFMRPLQPPALRDHLTLLASPPNETTEEEVIKEFFVDGIKTHCLVQFYSISAASRVRLALHDRVWPDERARKALWVDYIPEEKIKKWIEVEQEGGGRRGAPQKRFEVVYENEDGEIVAYLQEADGLGARGSMSAVQSKRNGIVTAPPKPIAPSAPQGDPGKGFKQLDDLFKSTTAKPKLYFQPVSEPIAGKRLDLLATGKGGGRNDEMRRFSFENNLIVDRGPEFGSGWRGGLRGRGGYGRGYSSRGGYRGDSWRDSSYR